MPHPGEPAESFGHYLQREREMREISLEEIAAYTRIKLRALEAIEQDDLAALPPLAFVRAFIRCYADYIGLEVGDVMLRFDSFVQSRYPEMTGEVQVLPQRTRPRQRYLPILFAVVVAVTVIFAYWWHRRPSEPESIRNGAAAVEPAPPDPAAMRPTADALTGSTTAAPSRAPDPAPAAATAETPPIPAAPPPRPLIEPRTEWQHHYDKPLGPPAPARPSTPQQPPSEPAPEPSPVPSTTSGADNPPPPAGIIVDLKAKDTCWVRFQKDNEGFRDVILEPGQELYFEAAIGVRLQIGKPENVTISYNNEPFPLDLAPASPFCLSFPPKPGENQCPR